MYKDVARNLDTYKIEYPKTIVPTPTDLDYSLGFIRRYFVRKRNDENGHIFEISKDSYTEYEESPFWKTDTLKWRIRGPISPTYKDNGEVDDVGVINSNKAAIALVQNNLKNIGLYLPNLKQFWK
jgi:hypothetical protein